jgi:hypothetical protein
MCTDQGTNAYSCQCPAGYTGTNCQTNINDCSPNPCMNGGSCTDGVNSYTCACTGGYTGAQCQTPPAPSYCTIEYAMSATFRISNTTLGLGNGTFNNQPGKLIVRYRDNGAGVINSSGSAELIYYSLHQMFDIQNVYTNVNAFSPTCSGNPTPSTTNPPASCNYDGNTTAFAAGNLSGSSLAWDTCTPAGDYGASNKNAYTPADVSSGPGCLNNYRSYGDVDCQSSSFNCGQGNLSVGHNAQMSVWVQPLNNFTFTGSGGGNSLYSSLSMTEINIPNSSPSRTWLQWTATRIAGANTTCN